MKRTLALDLSTKSTGWSVFHGKQLVDYGKIKTPKIKGITKMKYPHKQTEVLNAVSDEIACLIFNEQPDQIVIEEINRGINRLAQKTLDALHFFVMAKIEDYIHVVTYLDSDGRDGWRKRLDLKLSDEDKKFNKKIRSTYKTKSARSKYLVDKKLLAQKFVNAKYSTEFDVKEDKTDEDVCDSIGLGHAFLHFSNCEK